MKSSVGKICAIVFVSLVVTGAAFASAYNANPTEALRRESAR
jgi:hypothetical protein